MKKFVFEDHQIDKEALRRYIFDELSSLNDYFHSVLHDTTSSFFWNQIRSYIATEIPKKEQKPYYLTLNQIENVHQFIEGWITSAVESPERMDFFVLSKASELKTGDMNRDYFWALQIRHDQLVALVKVLRSLKIHMDKWIKLSPQDFVANPVYLGMIDYPIEEQVYIEAEKVYRERIRNLK